MIGHRPPSESRGVSALSVTCTRAQHREIPRRELGPQAIDKGGQSQLPQVIVEVPHQGIEWQGFDPERRGAVDQFRRCAVPSGIVVACDIKAPQRRWDSFKTTPRPPTGLSGWSYMYRGST